MSLHRICVAALLLTAAVAAMPCRASEWPAALAPALEQYKAGDYRGARELADQLAQTAGDPRLRREAAALSSLVLLRMPGRSDRIDGGARLAQLAREDPALLERPDCLLATGTAAIALKETATALDHLDRAVLGFETFGDEAGLADAYEALAEAWSHHTEWERTPARFDVPRSPDSAQAARLRRAQIEKLLSQIETRAHAGDARARVALVLARYLLTTSETADEGVAKLRELAAAEAWTNSNAQAAMLLAERLGERQEWREVLALLDRAEKAQLGDLSTRAGEQARDIRSPQLVLDVPASAPPSGSARIGLRARNTAAVQIEVRRLDLPAFLSEKRGRLIEAQLPVEGAVIFTRLVETAVAGDWNWWDSASLNPPLEFTAESGAFVVYARATKSDSPVSAVKRLVIISDLRAALFTGAQGAAVWVLPRTNAATPAGAAASPTDMSFWIQGGSFVPTQLRFSGDAARCTLPPEARLLKERRWLCLVRRGDALAVCQGELPPAAPLPVLCAPQLGPPRPQAGERLTVSGMLLAPWGAAFEPATPTTSSAQHPAVKPEYLVDFVDVTDRKLLTQPVAVDACGLFSASVEIPADWAGKHVNLVVRHGEHVLENLRGRLNVQVQAADFSPVWVECAVRPWISVDADGRSTGGPALLAARFSAEYPWGTPLTDGRLHLLYRGLQLPDPARGQGVLPAPPSPRMARLDSQGRALAFVPLADFVDVRPPLALSVTATIFGWDGRSARAFGEALAGPARWHAWLNMTPAAASIGEEMQFSLEWFDPSHVVTVNPGGVEVRRGDERIAHLPLYATTTGLATTAWKTDAVGEYTAIAQVAVSQPAGGPTTAAVSRVFSVRSIASAPPVSDARCTAEWLDTPEGRGVRVRVTCDAAAVKPTGQPALFLLETDEPLAVQSLRLVGEQTELFVPVDEVAPIGARARILAINDAGLVAVASASLEPAASSSLTLHAESGLLSVPPGGEAVVRVQCRRGQAPVEQAAVLARLIDADETGYLQWMPGHSRGLLASTPGTLSSAISGALDDSAATGPLLSDAVAAPADDADSLLSEAMVGALFEGTTLWTQAFPVRNGAAEIRVPVPQRPRRYRLLLLARSADRATAENAVMIDASDGVQALLDVPARLTVGDRTLAVLTLVGNDTRPTEATVKLDPGAGVSIESLRLIGSTAGQAPPPSPDSSEAATTQPTLTPEPTEGCVRSVHVMLGAGQRARVRMRIEASHAGDGAFVSEINSGAQRLTVQQRYHTNDNGTPTSQGAEAALKIRRTILKLARRAEQPAPVESAIPLPIRPDEWDRTLMTPDEQLPPGQLLLVREEFDAPQTLDGVTWMQSLPATCNSVVTEIVQSPSIGQLKRRDLDLLGYAARRISDGMQTHEYCIVTVRPGVCTLPPPTIRAGQQQVVPVEVEPAMRIAVSGAE